MTWSTDWPNAVSEVVTEIETIVSNQVTDESNISTLQTQVATLAGDVDAITYSVGSSSLPATSTSTFAGEFCEILAYGFAGASATALEISVNSTVIYSGLTVQNSQEFLLEAHFVFDAGTGNLMFQVVSPIEDTNQRYKTVNISGSPSTLTFSINTNGGSVSLFVMKYV
jgi:hypothetical protein